MERLTKYKNGKFLLNHSSMNEAIDKLGKLEIINQINNNSDLYCIVRNVCSKDVIGALDIAYARAILSEDGEKILIVQDNRYNGGITICDTFEFKDYQKTWSLNKDDLENGKEEND